MAIDSASATSPRSSLVTICSSSASACSKVSCSIGTGGFASAMASGRHQLGDMGGGRVADCLQVVAAFEQADDAAAGGALGRVHQDAGRPAEIVLGQVDRSEGIAPVRIETAGHDDQVGLERGEGRQDAIV